MRFLLTKRALRSFTPRFQRLWLTHTSFSSTSDSGDSEPGSWRTMEGLLRSPANFSPLSPITFLERSAKVYRDRTSLVFGSDMHTWFQTYQRCLRLASALTHLGTSPGDVVAALAPNVPAMHELHFAVPMAGLVLCPLNTRLDPSTLAVLLAHSEAKILFVDQQLLELAHGALDLLVKSDRTRKSPKLVLISHSNDDRDGDDDESDCSSKYSFDYEYETLVKSGNSGFEVNKPRSEWDPISINYTSGTTSRPKGVVYSHRGAYLNSLATVFLHEMSVSPVYLWTVPMFHCNGWCLIWGVAAQGGTNICLRKVSPKLIFKNIAMHKVTHMGGAPTVLNMIVNSPVTEHKPLPHKVEIMTGGSPPQPQILAKMEELGFNVSHLYGLTETYGPGTHCVWKPEWDSLSLEERSKLKARQGVQHLGLEGLEVKDPVTMKSVPDNGLTMGEVMFRGNTVMSGYFKDLETTRKAFEGDWFHSGDLAVKHPDGYIEIKDRLKDVIISGGENISSVEVERVLCSHQAVLEAAVVARPDNHWGQTPCGFVKLKDGFDGIKPEEIIGFCRDHLPHYMAPKTIVFGDIPKTSTGKVPKYLLRKRAEEMGSL
ncbi:PREDICTED: probable acyl-activating enzyme 2 [Camelina sativa]|uniref:Probable acyl-activating enzyme 2 n=1 Tax=Camelina sativa TaxID=90675 RepID=A0ABM0XQI3_CAMSA|nr:PREDICTED: probable acyl-activating enzyme 2 [Camelina sativa]